MPQSDATERDVLFVMLRPIRPGNRPPAKVFGALLRPDMRGFERDRDDNAQYKRPIIVTMCVSLYQLRQLFSKDVSPRRESGSSHGIPGSVGSCSRNDPGYVNYDQY
jgi:hypothetical protein